MTVILSVTKLKPDIPFDKSIGQQPNPVMIITVRGLFQIELYCNFPVFFPHQRAF